MATATRGSELLFKKSNLVDIEQLSKIYDISEEYGKILDWCWFGQPGIDGFCGTVRVDLNQAGRLVQDLLLVDEPRMIFKGFPYGIPAPDELMLEISTRGRAEF